MTVVRGDWSPLPLGWMEERTFLNGTKCIGILHSQGDSHLLRSSCLYRHTVIVNAMC